MSNKQLIRLTENDLYNIINESVKTLIIESQESKSQSDAIKYLMQKMNWDKERANNFVRNDLRQDITALRDKNIAKFTLGVTRMFCDRQLSDARILSNLNATLKLLSAHLNEYDRNLNGLSAQELIDRFAQTRQYNVSAEKVEIDSMDFSQGSKYQIVPINSFEEAQNYYEYTNPNSRWCLTHMDDMFDSYTCNGINQIYFCLRKGFESEPCEVGENAPLDDYGLSMLSIIVNENGELAYCTTRWNHDNGGSDSSMSAKEVSQVVGVNFYQVFKPNNKWQTILSDVKEKMSHGVPYDRIFDWIGNFIDGYAWVELNDKCNFINTNGDFISDQWFDAVGNFKNGFALVELNGKHNFINTNGDFISNQWFDDACNFNDGYAGVSLNDKWNFINTNVEFISDQWFDDIDNFKNGYAVVSLNDKWNFINTIGDFISDKWFDSVGDFNDGYAVVGLNGKGNFINTNVEFISDQWFDVVSSFNNGYARVGLNGEWNFINTNGNFISDQWFDRVGNFKNGYAKVELNGKNYKFNPKDGKLYNITENKQYNNMAKKQLIKLTEGDLHNIIKESVNRILNEGKHYSYPCLPNLNTKVVEYVKTKHPNEVLPYDRDDDDRYYVEALLNLGFKRDGYDRDGSEVFSNGKLRVTLSIDSINNVLIVSPANGHASTLGL